MFAKIRQYLNLGEAIPEASVAITRARNLLEPVPQPLVDLPGELSEKGPRHNNDFHNIELISILPTSDELNSDRPDFLPKRGDSAVHYEQGVKRLLDEQFRLLREDTVGVLRDAVRGVVSDWNTILGGTAKARASALRRLQTKCIIYPAAFLEKCTVDKRDGLVVLMSFAQPHQLAQKTHAARKKFWKEDNGHSLQRGNIVALVEGRTQSTVFLLVSDRTVIERTREAEDDAKDLASHPSRAFIELKLVNPTSTDDQIRLLSVVRCVPGDAILVEFPGLLFASFEPVLKGLQTLHRSADVPFVDYIVPHTYEFRAQDHLVASGGAIDVPPPLYLSRSPDLILDLSCITVNKHPLAHSVNQPVTIAQLRAHTTLDPGQCQAFIHALSSELALLQGPPGTGKSYIGVQIVKVLLANKRALDLGPVICVGYTNHALDQFVEHLLDSGITNMVRMGSRSQSERLQKCTLQSFEKTKTMGEKRLAAICYSKMDGLVDELRIGLTHIAKPITAVNIGFHLEQTTPWTPYHSVLFPSDGPDKEGFTVASGRSKHSEYKFWSAGRDSRGRPARITSDRALDEIVRFLQYAPSGLWDLSLAERKTLINQWEEEIILSRQNRIRRAVAELTECQQDLKAHHLESDKRALENVDIIGITTTGLATNSRLLRSLNSKLVICEEAAEILEAHTITALLPNLEHAVLIGDHLQLRPKISDYKLSLESPGGSMWPRLMSSVACTRGSVYPEVGGMRKRLFWLDHSHYEDSAQSDDGPQQTSKTNRWEAEMLIALVRHLKRQGMYSEKEDIAVITPYLGQLRLLKKLLQQTFELVLNDRDLDEIALAEENDPNGDEQNEPSGPAFTATTSKLAKGKLSDSVRIATIDNYQGEEAKIILITLHGMFIIGNADTATHIKMWAEVVENLEKDDSIAKALPLCFKVQCNVDMQKHRCQTLCGDLLPCGHSCNRKCYQCTTRVTDNDGSNKIVTNHGVCQRVCGRNFSTCSHSCAEVCASDSVQSEVVDFIMMETYREIDLNADPVIWLPCGHVFTLSSMDCSMDIGGVYELDRNGQPIAPKPVPYMQMNVKRCPTCRTAPRQKQAQLQGRLMTQTRRVADYVKKVSESEQPYGRVRRLVLDAQRRNTGSTDFDVDSSHIQHGFRFRGSVLLLRIWWAGLAGLAKLRTTACGAESLSDGKKVEWLVGNLEEEARETGYEKESLAAAIYEVQFAALAVQVTGGTNAEDQLARGRDQLDECEARIVRLKSAQYLMDDVENARRFINAGAFYTLVSSEEKQQVYAAMAREFAGTGHWYLCPQGHPFTVGECGMPMERASCPECGSPVGGAHHMPDAGVTRAAEFDREFANLHVR
ncbi:hypothetical protein BDZ88DRAFT_487300 [Geranomyces variabilis]|nr:hypothetical protein BDZ88DRAFT_487300 [Geranomyces variabilis]